MFKCWEVTQDLQVLPMHDSRDHVLSEKCWCKPTITEDGILIHHSADQREKYENVH